MISHHDHDDVFYVRFLIMTTSESEPPCVLGCQYIKPHSLQMLLLTIPDVAEDNVFLSLWRCDSRQFQLSPSHSACIPNPLSQWNFPTLALPQRQLTLSRGEQMCD